MKTEICIGEIGPTLGCLPMSFASSDSEICNGSHTGLQSNRAEDGVPRSKLEDPIEELFSSHQGGGDTMQVFYRLECNLARKVD